MPKASPSAPKAEKERVMKERMDAWKEGEMHSGTGRKGEKHKEPVRNYKQAVAIALSESGQSKKDKGRKTKRSSGRHGGR